MLLLFLRWLRPFLQLQCSTKPSQETYGLASLALVAAFIVLQCLTFSASPASRSMIARFMLGGFSPPRAPQGGPRAIPYYFFSLQERPRSLQEGFPRGSASRTRFGPHFGPMLGVKNGTPRLRKNSKILARVIKNQGFAVLSRGPVFAPFLDPSPGSILDPQPS